MSAVRMRGWRQFWNRLEAIMEPEKLAAKIIADREALGAIDADNVTFPLGLARELLHRIAVMEPSFQNYHKLRLAIANHRCGISATWCSKHAAYHSDSCAVLNPPSPAEGT